jgi:hypothetical protein
MWILDPALGFVVGHIPIGQTTVERGSSCGPVQPRFYVDATDLRGAIGSGVYFLAVAVYPCLLPSLSCRLSPVSCVLSPVSGLRSSVSFAISAISGFRVESYLRSNQTDDDDLLPTADKGVSAWGAASGAASAFEWAFPKPVAGTGTPDDPHGPAPLKNLRSLHKHVAEGLKLPADPTCTPCVVLKNDRDVAKRHGELTQYCTGPGPFPWRKEHRQIFCHLHPCTRIVFIFTQASKQAKNIASHSTLVISYVPWACECQGKKLAEPLLSRGMFLYPLAFPRTVRGRYPILSFLA